MIIAFGFPLFYSAVTGANVYGGWRQLLFVYPPLLILSAVGISILLAKIEEKKGVLQTVTISLCLLLIHPTYYLVRNYPYQYTYFNNLTGGVDGAYANYELDYYFTSFKNAYKYLDEHVEASDQTVAANFIIPEYYEDKSYRPKLIDYYNRSASEWEYAVICNTFLIPFQLSTEIWPPENTIYMEKIGDRPILAIIKRETKKDFAGIRLAEQGNTKEAISELEDALVVDSRNESILIALAKCYVTTGDYKRGEDYLIQLDHIYPDNEWAAEIRAEIQRQNGNMEEASAIYKRNISNNYKFFRSYVNLAETYIQLGQVDEAITILKKCLRINPFYKPAYQLYGQILIDQGQVDLGRRMLELEKVGPSKYDLR